MIAHAQIGGLDPEAFIANNVTATERLIAAVTAREGSLPRAYQLVGGESAAIDCYTESKKAQEKLVLDSGLRLRGAAADADVRLVRPQASRLARALHGARCRCSRFPATAAICASRSMPAISATSSWPASSSAPPAGLQHLRPGADRLHRPDPRRARARSSARAPIVQGAVRAVLGAALAPMRCSTRSALHHQAARGAGDAGRVRGDRLAGHLRREADAARTTRLRETYLHPHYSQDRAGVLDHGEAAWS